MTTAGLFFARARAAMTVLVSLAAVVLVATLALGITLGSVRNGVESGSREVLDAASPQSAAVRVETHLADDSAAQTDAALGMIAELFPAGTVDVHPEYRSLPVDVRGSEPASLVFGVLPSLLDDATVESGTWPSDGAAIQADAAAALGLGVGDEIIVGSDTQNQTIAVAALWRADDPASPRWFADPTVASGRDGAAYGVAVVDEAVLRDLPTQLFSSWTITPTPLAVDGDRGAEVTAALRSLPDAVRATDGVEDVSSTTEGTLAATLDRIADAGRGATAIAASAVIIVGLLAVVAIAQLSTVLVGSRRRQAELIRARGLSLPQLAVLAGVEALLVAVPAAAAGSVAAALVVGGGSPWTLVAIAAGVCLATAVCLATVVLLDARAGSTSGPAAPSAAPFVSGGVVVGIAAALATLQLYNRGTVPGVDVVGATSPALALVAISVLGTALFFPVAARIARSAARSGHVGAVLAARQIARRVARYLVPVLALAIAVASAVFATGLATTWSATERSARFVGIGADVVVSLPNDGGTAVTSADYAELGDVRAASSLVLSTVGLGSDTIPFVAVSSPAAERVLGDDGSAAVGALETTTPDDAGVGLAADATGITADVVTSGRGGAPTSTFDVGVWAADADGALSRVSLEPGADGWTAPLPDGAGPWRLLSVEIIRTGKPDPAVSGFTVSELGAGVGGATDPVEVDVSQANPRAATRIAAGDDAALPIVVTDALAERLGIGVGDRLTFDFDATGTSIDAVVSALTPLLPGTASRLAVGTDLRALDAVSLRPGSEPALTDAVWISTGSPDAVADEVAGAATSTAIVTTPASTSSNPVVAAALVAFWLAAVAAALLALVAVSAFFVDDFRARRDEIAVLRALGLSTAAQVATRRRELVVTTVFAAVVGTVGGAVTTAVIVGPFIASTVPTAAAFVRVLPAFDPLPWLLYCAAVAAAGCAISLALLAGVRRASSTAIVEPGNA